MAHEQVLIVPGRYNEIKRICEFVAAGAAEAGFDDDTIFHLELCCDEASTNIIEHAYGQEGAGNIVISYAIAEDEFTIVLRDNGQAFDPANVPPPPAISRESIPLDELAAREHPNPTTSLGTQAELGLVERSFPTQMRIERIADGGHVLSVQQACPCFVVRPHVAGRIT